MKKCQVIKKAVYLQLKKIKVNGTISQIGRQMSLLR
jgi:hypothetical protein